MIRTFKICSFSSFQIDNTVLTIVIMLFITSSWLIYFLTGCLYLLTIFIYFAHCCPPPPTSACMCVHAQSCPTLWPSVELWPARLICPWRFSGKKYWSGLLFPTPADLPEPGIEPASLAFPAFGRRIHNHWITWKACHSKRWSLNQWGHFLNEFEALVTSLYIISNWTCEPKLTELAWEQDGGNHYVFLF